jgi:hypothetical protein
VARLGRKKKSEEGRPLGDTSILIEIRVDDRKYGIRWMGDTETTQDRRTVIDYVLDRSMAELKDRMHHDD